MLNNGWYFILKKKIVNFFSASKSMKNDRYLIFFNVGLPEAAKQCFRN